MNPPRGNAMPLPRLALAAVAALAAAGPALAGDYIQRPGGFLPPIEGKEPSARELSAAGYEVLSADATSVQYRMPGNAQPQRMNAADVVEIWLDTRKVPGSWRDAETAQATGNFKAAAEKFRALAEDSKVHGVLRQRAWMKHVLAVRESGSADELKAAHAAAEAAFPASFYQRAIIREVAQGLRDAGDEAGAAAAADRLEKLPGTPESDKTWTRLLRLSVAYKSATRDGDTAAIRKCQDEAHGIATSAAGKPGLEEVSLQARLMQANCMLALKDAKSARSLFEDVVARASTAPVLASAHNGLGECLVAEGGTPNFQKAQLHFLRVTTLYTDGTPGDELARALVRTAEMFLRLQETPDWAQRCLKEANECLQRFPRSRWKDEASNLRSQALAASKPK
jgi:hypothetical protein